MHHARELSCVWLQIKFDTIRKNSELFVNYNDRKWKEEMKKQPPVQQQQQPKKR
jgi:hypothetical protein